MKQKTHITRLNQAVARGGEPVITQQNKPVARIIQEKAESEKKPERVLGALAHLNFNIDGFDDPALNKSIEEDFYAEIERSDALP
jgi:antitoxin (DNA-binding transcriptional repressor) of toxin-antitoxin stability system